MDDVKILSSIIGHVSSATTLDIYSHVTDSMQLQAANKIEKEIGKNEQFGANESPIGKLSAKRKTRRIRRISSRIKEKSESRAPAVCIRSAKTSGQANIHPPEQTARRYSEMYLPKQEKNAKSCFRK